jgi:hypothetical protein
MHTLPMATILIILKKYKIYWILTAICLASFLIAILVPPIEFLPSILAMPGVIAMIGVIYQILRDQAAHENKLEQQQHKLFLDIGVLILTESPTHSQENAPPVVLNHPVEYHH